MPATRLGQQKKNAQKAPVGTFLQVKGHPPRFGEFLEISAM